jgi:hypothetical protein
MTFYLFLAANFFNCAFVGWDFPLLAAFATVLIDITVLYHTGQFVINTLLRNCQKFKFGVELWEGGTYIYISTKSGVTPPPPAIFILLNQAQPRFKSILIVSQMDIVDTIFIPWL